MRVIRMMANIVTDREWLIGNHINGRSWTACLGQ
jgi:hypothetical protein